MKKRLISLSAILMAMVLLLSGCGIVKKVIQGRTGATLEATSEPAPTLMPASEPTPASEMEDTEPEASESDFYEGATMLQNGELLVAKEGKYAYYDFCFTVPKEWDQRVLIKVADDGVILYQRASYDSYEGMGFLFSMNRAKEQPAFYTGGGIHAYTNDYFYYYYEPSDVPYVYEDADISEDYSEVISYAREVFESWKIDSPDARYDADEFMFPLSSVKLVSEELLEYMNIEELTRATNEIYARHGQIFDDYYVNNYFLSCSWYEGTVSDPIAFDDLNEIEQQNIAAFEYAMENNSESLFIPIRYDIDQTADVDMCGDGVNHSVLVNLEGAPGEGYKYILTIDGTDYSTEDFGIEIENADEGFYITQIQPYGERKEIAVLDYGMDDYRITHFFYMNDDGQFGYIGEVMGNPFDGPEGIYDGFVRSGSVKETTRSYMLGTHNVYQYRWYDYTEYKFDEPGMYGMYYYWPEPPYELLKDIKVSYDALSYADSSFVMKAGERVAFIWTDNESIVYLKSVDTGKKGYLEVDSRMEADFRLYFEGLR